MMHQEGGANALIKLKLDRLESATMLRDLAFLPANRFEALLGDRKGQYSIRINEQWRTCFEWPDKLPGPANVELKEFSMSAAELARKLGVPTNRVTGIGAPHPYFDRQRSVRVRQLAH
jgi:proteic killer suppression protein